MIAGFVFTSDRVENASSKVPPQLGLTFPTASNEKTLPPHKYSFGGTYDVSLSVTDDDGATNTFSLKLKIHEEAVIHEDYVGWVVIIIVFLVIFSVLIGLVYYIYKKYSGRY